MPKYRFGFDTNGVYAHAFGLVERTAKPDRVVLDLGCGYGAIAERVVNQGWHYLGFDFDAEAVKDVGGRGFDARVLDLRDPAFNVAVQEALAGRPLGAILLLDVVEHMLDSKAFMSNLSRLVDEHPDCVLIVSIPNVAHFDVGAKLLTGRWDVTPTGLLDETHLHFFTERSLTSFMAEFGWDEIERDDFPLAESDQHFPRLHPVLVAGTPLRTFTEWLRAQADPFGFVNQFVRAYKHGRTSIDLPTTPSQAEPFLSVLLRTQGMRLGNLRDALTCLAAQTVQDFECLLLVHTSEEAPLASVHHMAADFQGAVGSGIRIVHVQGGGRARPLNRGLREARGRYVAFLDDDDHVTSSWVGAFQRGAEAAPAGVVRTWAWAREIEHDDDVPSGVGFTLRGWPNLSYGAPFDFMEHLDFNKTPICTFAVPVEAIRFLGLSFDEDLPVLEDWDFLLRAAHLLGVHDEEEATSIYHHWSEGESSRSIDAETWARTREHIQQSWNERPLLLGLGGARRIIELQQQKRSIRALESRAQRTIKAETATKKAEEKAAKAEEKLKRLLQSKSWRLSAPFRRASRALHRFVRGMRSGRRPPTEH